MSDESNEKAKPKIYAVYFCRSRAFKVNSLAPASIQVTLESLTSSDYTYDLTLDSSALE
jgi:hypothetical protein